MKAGNHGYSLTEVDSSKGTLNGPFRFAFGATLGGFEYGRDGRK